MANTDMSSHEPNPYSPPVELDRTTVGGETIRRPPVVSGLLCAGLLLLTTLPFNRWNGTVGPEEFSQILIYVVAWTAILSCWASTVVYRIVALSTPKPSSSRGIAMLSACVLVAVLGLIMINVGSPPSVFLLPLGVVMGIIVSYARSRNSNKPRDG